MNKQKSLNSVAQLRNWDCKEQAKLHESFDEIIIFQVQLETCLKTEQVLVQIWLDSFCNCCATDLISCLKPRSVYFKGLYLCFH